MKKLNHFLEANKAYGIVPLRIVAGWRLTAGVWPYATQAKPISEAAAFFHQLHMPQPLLSAYVSVYARFVCGLFFIIGFWVRPAALVMIINFLVAVFVAHLNDRVEKSFAAWALLAMAISFLFFGAGKISIDEQFKKTNKSQLYWK